MDNAPPSASFHLALGRPLGPYGFFGQVFCRVAKVIAKMGQACYASLVGALHPSRSCRECYQHCAAHLSHYTTG